MQRNLDEPTKMALRVGRSRRCFGGSSSGKLKPEAEAVNWRLANGNWKLEAENWKLETGNWKLTITE
jgi:hypothetical protein